MIDFVSIYCRGEKCPCGQPAAHKVSEEIFDDDPNYHRHPLTAYICTDCFNSLFRVFCPLDKKETPK